MPSKIASEIRKIADQMLENRKKYQQLIKDIKNLWKDQENFLKVLHKELVKIHSGKLTEDQFQRFCIQAYDSQGIVKPEAARLLFHTHTTETTSTNTDMSIDDIDNYLQNHSKYAVDTIYDPIFNRV